MKLPAWIIDQLNKLKKEKEEDKPNDRLYIDEQEEPLTEEEKQDKKMGCSFSTF